MVDFRVYGFLLDGEALVCFEVFDFLLFFDALASLSDRVATPPVVSLLYRYTGIECSLKL